MMNFSLSTWLKQHRMTVGGILLGIAITSYSTTANSQLSAANVPLSASTLIASVQPSESDAVQVIRDYYSAINRRDYKQAYSILSGATQQSFEQFKQGFANTKTTTVKIGKPGEIDGAAGSLNIEIPVSITATTKNGTRQSFRGSYVLRRVNNVPGSTAQQRRWHISSAKITQVN
ncbi:MAG: hypothetical protein PUP93_33520 [Rhizonema sp. NSF051]|nr:hypothetical protein [Rhizonema sp. NSF051]